MAGALLEVAGLAAGYGELQVLWGVDLRVEPGDYVAVLGSNGVGKSTLLKTLAGLLTPTCGTIAWDGDDITRLPAPLRVRRGLVLVPEGKRLFSGMTVVENLMMGAFAREDRAEARRDLDWVLTLFPALRSRRGQIAGTLSGGEQQMCSLGRGLMARPRLLLVDELSFGLSPVVADGLLDAMAAINQDGVAIVLVEQDVVAALGHARRGYVIETGRVSRSASAAELLADPEIQRNYLGV